MPTSTPTTFARPVSPTTERPPANQGAWLLRRDEGDETEFITLSLWESEDAIRAFAGDDIEAAVLYPEDERFLLRGSSVTHFDVIDQVGN